MGTCGSGTSFYIILSYFRDCKLEIYGAGVGIDSHCKWNPFYQVPIAPLLDEGEKGLTMGSEYDKIPYSVVECKEHIDEALKMARKSCVLLKNDGVLPIDKTKVNTIVSSARMQIAVQLLLEIIMEHLQNILLFLKESVKKQVTM